MLLTIGFIIASIEDNTGKIDKALDQIYLALRSSWLKVLEVIGFLWFVVDEPKKGIAFFKRKLDEWLKGK